MIYTILGCSVHYWGAVRHKGSIPWDYDVDIAIPVTEMKRFVSIMEDKLPPEYRLDYRKNNEHLRIFPRVGLSGYTTKDLHVDVYPIIGLPSSLKKQKTLFFWIRKVVELISAKSYKYSGKKQFIAILIRITTFFISEKALVTWYDKLCRMYAYDDSTIVGCSNAASGYKRTFLKSDIEKITFIPYDDFEIRVPENYDRILRIIFGDYWVFPDEEERKVALNRKYIIKRI